MKLALRIVLVILFIAFLGAGYILWTMFSDRSEVVEHVDTVDWLPASASNISYYMNKNITGMLTCEFAIAESDFLDFAMQNEWPVSKMESPINVTRYTKFIEKSKTSDHYAVVEQGYYYSKQWPNGAHISVAYDLVRQIAYLNRSSR